MKKLLLLVAVLLTSSTIFAQWATQNTGFSAIDRGVDEIKIVDANVIWCKAYDGVTNPANIQEFTRTTNGGVTWTPGIIDISNPSYIINNLIPVNATTAFVSALDNSSATGPWPGGVWKTVDSGLTWTQQVIGTNGFTNPTSFINGVHFYNATTGIAYGDPVNGEFEIYRTTDGGANWTLVPGASITDPGNGEAGYNGGNVAAGNTFWFVTNLGKLYRSTNQGLIWSRLSTPITDFSGTSSGGRIYFSNDNNGFLLARTTTGSGSSAVNTYKIHKTTNGGLSWSAGVDFSSIYNLDLAYIPGTSTVVATGIDRTVTPIVYKTGVSNDNGSTWTQIDSGTQRVFLNFLNGTTGWASGFSVAGGQQGIYKYTGAPLSNLALEQGVVNAFPNPTSGILEINNSREIIKVEVFSLTGNLLKSFNSKQSKDMQIDITEFKTGVYFIKVLDDNGGLRITKILKN
jgi:hypothetical protein